jgi:site-specific DNA-methyltransferase (adenine-specific)
MIPTLTIGNAQIYQGNNLHILPELADNSVDAIVCDPPYELGFMGKSWDSSGIAYSVELWRECLRVLKPGGHLLAFGGTRTWHRLAVAIEDAGFEIRDNIAWLYGSGFPKSHNISKAIDKAAGAEREVVGSRIADDIRGGNMHAENRGERHTIDITASATDEAKAWDGWGTALKPAHEPIVVARKAVEGTVAANVLTYGVGALNIDATRIGTETRENPQAGFIRRGRTDEEVWHGVDKNRLKGTVTVEGRWPANIILDEFTAELLDEQSGVSKSQGGTNPIKSSTFNLGSETRKLAGGFGDVGGASRFFYVAKASKRDRNEGLDELPEQILTGRDEGQDERQVPFKTRSNVVKNIHPTVKPTALMQYLIRLVTPEGGVVLDPFAGSGSTGKAAILEGKQFIGIELTADYLPIIEGRLQHAYETTNTEGDDLFE